MAVAATMVALFADQACNAQASSFTPNLQPFQCDKTQSMNVAKFTSSPTTVPLMLETVVHGTTCGYEGGQITGIEGVQLTKLMLEIEGTHNAKGFGPYIQIFYNGSQVTTVPISSGKFVGNFPPYGVMLEWNAQQLNLPVGAEISAMRIIANPTAAQDGKCFIRQVHINGTLVTKTHNVIDACP